MTLSDEFFERLGDLSRRAYVLAYAISDVTQLSPASFGGELQARFEQFCEDGKRLDPEAIKVRPDGIRQAQTQLPQFVADLLLVALEAEFHGLLMRLVFPTNTAEMARPLEELFAEFAPPALRGRHEWAYRDAILMAEIRNSIVHGQGTITEDNPRLLAAGWKVELLREEACLNRRSFSDFLRFKRCVRNIASYAVRQKSDNP